MSEIIERETTKQALKPPSLWNVIFVNDDYTTMEFVMECLQSVFGKTPEQSYMIMLQIHEQGKGIVNSYVKEIAISKQIQAQEFAQQQGHPLKVEVEPID